MDKPAVVNSYSDIYCLQTNTSQTIGSIEIMANHCLVGKWITKAYVTVNIAIANDFIEIEILSPPPSPGYYAYLSDVSFNNSFS